MLTVARAGWWPTVDWASLIIRFAARGLLNDWVAPLIADKEHIDVFAVEQIFRLGEFTFIGKVRNSGGLKEGRNGMSVEGSLQVVSPATVPKEALGECTIRGTA